MRWVLVLVVVAGCAMTIQRDPSEDVGARSVFDMTVAPLLATNCVSCHFTGSNLIPLTYESITTNDSLNGNYNPEAAGLLTKGVHEGPAWDGVQTTDIVEWLYDEGAARH
ncbi:MAG: hypothetical protein QM831_40270 [Kofleriaceae bacterium]